MTEEQQNLPYNRDRLSRVVRRSMSAYRQYRFNHSYVSDFNRRNVYLKGLLHAKGLFQIKQPFYCTYGDHIYLGRDFTCGHHCVFDDEADIRIGDHVQLGNGVTLATTRVMKDPALRKKHKEVCADIVIGDHVYIGHNVTILAGVTIGSCAIIGDGSVVSECVEAGTVVNGNPAVLLQEESDCISPFEKSELLLTEDEDSLIEKIADHINLEKVDFAVHVAALGLGAVAGYRIIKELMMKKAELEEKKALVEAYLPIVEKLPEVKQLRQTGRRLKEKIKR